MRFGARQLATLLPLALWACGDRGATSVPNASEGSSHEYIDNGLGAAAINGHAHAGVAGSRPDFIAFVDAGFFLVGSAGEIDFNVAVTKNLGEAVPLSPGRIVYPDGTASPAEKDTVWTQAVTASCGVTVTGSVDFIGYWLINGQHVNETKIFANFDAAKGPLCLPPNVSILAAIDNLADSVALGATVSLGGFITPGTFPVTTASWNINGNSINIPDPSNTSSQLQQQFVATCGDNPVSLTATDSVGQTKTARKTYHASACTVIDTTVDNGMGLGGNEGDVGGCGWYIIEESDFFGPWYAISEPFYACLGPGVATSANLVGGQATTTPTKRQMKTVTVSVIASGPLSAHGPVSTQRQRNDDDDALIMVDTTSATASDVDAALFAVTGVNSVLASGTHGSGVRATLRDHAASIKEPAWANGLGKTYLELLHNAKPKEIPHFGKARSIKITVDVPVTSLIGK